MNTLVTHRTDIIKTQAKINTDMIHKIDNLTILTKGTTLKVDNPTKPPATLNLDLNRTTLTPTPLQYTLKP